LAEDEDDELSGNEESSTPTSNIRAMLSGLSMEERLEIISSLDQDF
jgi:hypothetical protein